MRRQIRAVQRPIKSFCRQVTTSAQSQSSEGPLDATKPSARSCPVQGRSRSTHAALDSAVFETVTSVKSWDDVPGPKPLPLLGNTWRFAPFIELVGEVVRLWAPDARSRLRAPRLLAPAPARTALLQHAPLQSALALLNCMLSSYSVEHIDKLCLSLRKQYGNCVKMAGLLGRPDMLFVFDAGEVERVFRSEDGAPHRPSMPSLNYYKHVLRKDFFGAEENCAGVIAVHGDSWSAFRTKVSRVALSASAAAQYTVAVSEVADAFIDRIREVRTEASETPSDFLNEVHKWSLESLCLIALDTRLGCFNASAGSESQTLIDAVNTFFLCVGELELRTPWWRIYNTTMFKQYVSALDTILSVTLSHVERALEESRNSSSRSLLQGLVAAAGARVAAVAALDMFLVGIDTTSNAVASTLYQLSLRPDIQEKIYEEVSNVLEDRPLQPGDFSQMPYLKACVKEVLRMYPVVIGNGRQLTKDTIICGYNIPRGTQVIFQHYVMGNSEECFSAAQEFRPERWLRRAPLTNHHPFASLPFGFGRRMCLGRRFAELEIHTVICKMVQAFKMEYHHEPLDYHVHPMYTPNGPIRIKLIDR